MRWNYWSCSRLADLIRGTDKPKYAASDEWYYWEHHAKADHPFRYWLAEEFLSTLQDIVYWPHDKYRDLRYYIKYRFIRPGNAMAGTSLKNGVRYDLVDRILHCPFDELVAYVDRNQERLNYHLEENIDIDTVNEIVFLAKWWKEDRWKRACPYEKTGWSRYCKEHPVFSKPRDPEDKVEVKRMLSEINIIEESYRKEDDDMLVRLIKVRGWLYD
jgi:hypothetical protein